MKFVVLSDVHYMAREMYLGEMHTDGSPDAAMRPAMGETALRMASEIADADTILITGDLTDAGDRVSHRALVQILDSLQAKGKKVYVTTATHDFHHGRAYVRKQGDTRVQFKNSPWDSPYFDTENADYKKYVRDEYAWMPEAACTPQLEEACSPAELWDIYRAFGRDRAFSVLDESYSYCVALDEQTWCIMLNDNYRAIEATDNASPSYSPACFRWIRSLVRQAAAEGKFIFACTHHPLVPPVPGYKVGASPRNMREAKVGHTLADIGIPLVFSGHSHFSDVAFMKSDDGNLLCDITTAGVCNYPPQFRVVELDGAAHKVQLTSVPILQVDGYNLGDKTLRAYIRENFIADYARKVQAMKAPLNEVVANLQVKHLYPLCKRAAKLTEAEYGEIKELRLFDIVMELILNMLGGDGSYTPDTPVYKFMMGLSATLDSIIDAQPFVDIRRTKLKGYSIRELIEPMLFNNFIPDNNAVFDFTKEPPAHYATHVFEDHTGDVLMGLLWVLTLCCAKFLPAAAIVALPALTLLKKRKLAKNPPKPERYY